VLICEIGIASLDSGISAAPAILRALAMTSSGTTFRKEAGRSSILTTVDFVEMAA